MIVENFGKFYRKLPFFRGKNLIARKLLAPFLGKAGGYECVVDMNTPGGGKLICNLDDWIPWNVYIHGRYQLERNYELFMMDVAKEAAVIFDIGANIGYYTIQFSRVGHGRVIAFEPVSYQYNVLLRNLDLNGIHNVHAVKKVVSDLPGVRRIYFSGIRNTGSSSVEITTRDHEDVESITLDDYSREEHLGMIDLMKIDVEGHELHVLKGMKEILEQGRVRNLFMEINGKALSTAGTTPVEVCSFLEGFGYFPYSIKTGKKEKYFIGNNESLVYFSQNGQ